MKKKQVKLGLKAPFPWFGGKRRVADKVWERFGDVPNYVEPFAGSLAVLLERPHQPHFETVNDKDGFVANFYRALAADPVGVGKWCDYPVNEIDQNARHKWLTVRRGSLTKKLLADPDYYDVKIAGWWVWGICIWIGAGWCSEKKMNTNQRQNLGDVGRGVGVHRGQRPHLTQGMGVHRVTLSDAVDLKQYLQDLFNRLRYVRVCCGDWKRILGPTPTEKLGVTAVFLDPPYGDERQPDLYSVDDIRLYQYVRDWAIEHGDNPKLRIALCGYDTELDMPDNWTCLKWKAQGGYATQAKGNTKAKENAKKEVVWFSPHCLIPRVGLLGRPL